MANRGYIDKNYTLVKGQVELYCTVSVGAAGAVTLQKWNYPGLAPSSSAARTYSAAPTTGGGPAFPLQTAQGAEGVFSVARTGTGLWTITLQDAYQRLIGLTGFSSLAGGLSAVVAVHENTSITNMNSGTPARSVLGVALLGSTGTAVDPASGERLTLRFTLQNSTAP
jgi:hypothetical protein